MLLEKMFTVSLFNKQVLKHNSIWLIMQGVNVSKILPNKYFVWYVC